MINIEGITKLYASNRNNKAGKVEIGTPTYRSGCHRSDKGVRGISEVTFRVVEG